MMIEHGKSLWLSVVIDLPVVGPSNGNDGYSPFREFGDTSVAGIPNGATIGRTRVKTYVHPSDSAVCTQ